jgi:hypothetical protein
MMAENSKKFGSMKAFITMLANHTKLDVGTINKMGARDLNGIQKYYDYFLAVGQHEIKPIILFVTWFLSGVHMRLKA